MKLLRYGERGHERPAILDAENRIRDLGSHIDDIDGAGLENGSVASLVDINLELLPIVSDDVRIAAPVRDTSKIVCIGLNYSDHAAEAGMEAPSEPIIFLKPTTAICGPDDPVIKPPHSTKLDWEVELGIVIGRTARHVTEEDALTHVAGYCVVNDVSERAFQMQSGQWDKGKGCDSFAPIGPWLVTRDEISDPQNLDLWLDVNGTRRQTGNTSRMIFGVAHLISYVSRYMTLLPGDIIATGTPPGVGMGIKPSPVFLEIGDRMQLGIDGLGMQTQTVVSFR